MSCIELTLSEWLYYAVIATEVLTLSRDYFRLRKGLERRLYELARKHCGLQAKFTIPLDMLLKKFGAMCSMKEFRRQIREVVASNTLLDYSLELDGTGDALTILDERRRQASSSNDRGSSTARHFNTRWNPRVTDSHESDFRSYSVSKLEAHSTAIFAHRTQSAASMSYIFAFL